MSNWLHSVQAGHAVGLIGLFLMLVIARLANHAYGEQGTLAERLTGLLARRAIDGIAAIGWLADRLPVPTASHGQHSAHA
jgi:hypothetical protein